MFFGDVPRAVLPAAVLPVAVAVAEEEVILVLHIAINKQLMSILPLLAAPVSGGAIIILAGI